jgi:hypothetical protein
MGVMDLKDSWSGIMDLTDFYINGFVKLYEPDLGLRTNVADYLGNKYLSQLFPKWQLIEFGEADVVEEWDRITVWHNDSTFVGCNVTFLYYMDDTNPDVGGSISIRNGLHEEQIYPKKGTLILMSQQPNVEHKAEYCKTRRRMYNIDYLVEGLT